MSERYATLWEIQHDLEGPARTTGLWTEILVAYLERRDADPEAAICIAFELEEEVKRLGLGYDRLRASTKALQGIPPVASHKTQA
ncbi:hypothetical protein WDZ92_31320 [Nostoc sp. NIES-2111]